MRPKLMNMIIRSVALFAAVCAVFSNNAWAAGEGKTLTVGRMKVTIMPEYDSPAVLVVQEGKFTEREAFPNDVRFTLPKEVTKLTDVCSLSPGGHHFCQIFKLRYEKDYSYIDIKLPYSDFFIDYQYAPFTVKPSSQRDFTYHVRADYGINMLEVHVQEPTASKDYSIDPMPADTYQKDGFTYSKYVFNGVKPGDILPFHIKYFKDSVNPSVEEKFSAMATPEIFKGFTGEILLGVAVAAIIGIGFIKKRRAARSTDGGGVS